MEYADLHIHSRYSDSDYTVDDIFAKAKEENLHAIALTDHDTVEGIKEAHDVSVRFGLELIRGIEISAQKDDAEIHVLGYLVDPENAQLLAALSDIRQIRLERLLKMIQKLNSLGMRIDNGEFIAAIGNAIPTRLHLALHMAQKNYVPSIWIAFKKYLGYRRSAYVARFRHGIKDAIRIIKEAGGLAYLAHPHLLPHKEWIKDFADIGLDGMEVVYPRYNEEMTAQYQALAKQYGLLFSGGSDSHGSYKEFTAVGKVKIPYEWVTQLKGAAKGT